jgi:hypothetical protein
MAQVVQHGTTWKRTLEGVSGLQSYTLTAGEQHCTGVQIDIEGSTTGLATVQYTPIGSVDIADKKTPIDNTVDDSNGLTLWPIKCSRLWIDLTPAGAGPFNVHLVGYQA